MKKHLLYFSIPGLLITLSVATVLSVTAPRILRADDALPSGTEIAMDGEDNTRAGYSGFVQINDSFRYYDPNTGEYLTGLQTIDGYTYYFYPGSGLALGGLQTIDGKEYYFNPTTKRQMTGIIEITYSNNTKRKHYFLKEGGKLSGWAKVNGKKYYFSSPQSGAVMLYGKQTIDGKLYCFDEVTGEQLIGVAKANDGFYYYFNEDGGVRNGLQTWNGNLYFFLEEKSGIMDYGLDGIGNALYFFDKTTGAAVKNKSVTVGHIIYTFGSDGKMTSAKAETGYENSKRAKLILAGLTYLGEPYALEQESGFSCGFFVKTALSHININVPTSSDQQAKAVVYNEPQSLIDESQLRVGDVIYWKLHGCGDSACTHWNEIHHVAIYVGNGKALESVEHRGCVTIDNIREYDSNVSSYHIKYYVRYIDEEGDPYVDENKEIQTPTNLQAVWDDNEGLLHLTWDHEGTADGFNVYYEIPGNSVLVQNITDGSARSLDTTLVKYSFTMTYSIEAYRNDSGTVSSKCQTTVYIPGIPSPETFETTYTDGEPNRVTFTWEYDLPAGGFYVELIDYYANTVVESLDVDKTKRSVTFENLEYGKYYEITIQTYRIMESNPITTTISSDYIDIPAPIAEDPTDVNATLSWSYSSSLVSGFNIYRDGTLLASLSDKTARTCKDQTIAYGKTYKYEVEAFRNVGSDTVLSAKVPFTITVPNIAPPAVTELKAQAAGKYKVTLTWNASTGAEGYLIYGQKNGSYGYVGMTTMGTSYTDKNAIANDYNFYWVFPYIKNVSGKMVPGGCTKYVFAKGVCVAVTNLRAASVKGGVKLTWTASPDADGYLIYGIVDGKPYGYVGMTTQGTTFTDKSASSEKYNYYWVYPYFKDEGGNMIVGLTGKYTYGRALPLN